MKAVIVDLREQRAAALCEDGSVRDVADLGYSLGQEIVIEETLSESAPKVSGSGKISFMKWYRRAAAAAAVALMLTGIGGATVYAMPYGEVSLEGDTSVVYTINRFDYVIGAEASDEAGEQILSEVGKKNLVNHKIETALAVTLDHIQNEEESGTDVEYHVRTDIRGGESSANEAHAEKLRGKLEEVLAEKVPERAEGSEGEHVSPLDGDPEETPEPAGSEPSYGDQSEVRPEEPGNNSGVNPEGGQEGRPAEQPENITENSQGGPSAESGNMPENGAEGYGPEAPQGQFEGLPEEQPGQFSDNPGEAGGFMGEMPG